MLASSANQLTGAEITVADLKARNADIMTLEFSAGQHDSVLLSPGKWNVGTAPSNQIVLNDDGVAPRQFLIIVTEHRSVIKDWTGRALWNGNSFESAILSDGDVVAVADAQLSFRLARSQDLIAQLPYVAEPACTSPIPEEGSAEFEIGQSETLNILHVTADGMLSFEESGDRLNELIRRIESSLEAESCGSGCGEADGNLEHSHAPAGELEIDSEAQLSRTVNEVATRTQVVESSLESQAVIIDDELLELEKLRAAVQLEREQLLAKRALLVQQTWEVESQLQDARQEGESAAVNDFELSDRLNDADASAIQPVDRLVPSDFAAGAVFDNSEVSFAQDVENDFGSQAEDEAVTAEREKLRHYLEEFDSVNAAESDDVADAKVVVGAAQAATEYTVMNALRSREDAVKQLDDLVLAATRGLDSLSAGQSGSSIHGPIIGQDNDSATSLPEYGNEFVSHNDDESDDDLINVSGSEVDSADTVVELEASVDELSSLIDEVDAAEPETCDATLDDAAEGDRVVESVDDEEDSPTFESEIIEEHPVVADGDYDDVLSAQLNSNESDTNPNAEVIEAASESVNSKLPSWFDSKFLAEGDSAVEDGISEGNSESVGIVNDDATGSADEEPADDLRQKLAEMFDLPSLSENTEQVVPDNPLDSRLLLFREEPADDELGKVDVGNSPSMWPEAADVDADESSESTLDSYPTMVNHPGADSDYLSERVDAFAPTDSVSEIETTIESGPQSGATFEPELQSEEEDSVSAYMERLLARNRQVTGGHSAAEETSPVVPDAASESDSNVVSGAGELAKSANTAETNSERLLEETPRHRQNRDQVRAETQVLRQIANQSARSAVATASRRDVRKQVIVKTIASVLSLGSGVAALLLDVSTPFGLVVLGIGMMFSVDLAQTIFRNWKQLRDLRRAAAALEGASRASDAEDATVAT